MHKLASTPITLQCFEIDDYYSADLEEELLVGPNNILQFCEDLRKKYLETNNKRYWKELIRWLPESWLQTRTVTMNYENLINIYFQRKNHKLNEWSGLDAPEYPNFCKWVLTLPYMKEIVSLISNKN